MSAAVSAARCLTNRRVFLEKHGMSPEKTVLVRVTYDTHDYCRYGLVTKDHCGDGIVGPSTITADALFTRQQDMALLLPLADCVGVGSAHAGFHGGDQVTHFAADGARRLLVVVGDPACEHEHVDAGEPRFLVVLGSDPLRFFDRVA